jgi:hypothetical protein
VHDTKGGLFILAFTVAPGITPLTCAIQLTRWPVLQKVRRHTEVLRLLVSIKFQVLFQLPNRDTFHLSLTVLVRYRSSNLFSLGRWPSRIQAGFLVSDPTQEHPTFFTCFQLRDYYALWLVFPDHSANKIKYDIGVLQPLASKCKVWACPFSLATTKGIDLSFFSLGTKMFQFSRSPPYK